MDEVDRYIPARNARGPGEGIAPKHATKWAQYSPEWYDACGAAFERQMKIVFGLEPKDPKEWTKQELELRIKNGDVILRNA